MAFSRYTREDVSPSGEGLEVSFAVTALRRAVTAGTIPIVRRLTTTEADRLDTLAGRLYGDSRYWWVLAATSNIGWGLQVPPGIVINVVDLRDVERAVG